jgi:hypothetical protein
MFITWMPVFKSYILLGNCVLFMYIYMLADSPKHRSMQKITSTILLCFILSQSFGQAEHKLAGYLQGQYNKTIHDRAVGNNPWAMGLGFQLLVNSRSKFKPTIELTADAYLEDDKVMRLNNDAPVDDIGGMVNLFAGATYQPTKTVYVSLVAGPGFISGHTLFGIKPSVGFYFSQKQRCTGKLSYINLFNRDKLTKEDFGSISVSLAVKLF